MYPPILNTRTLPPSARAAAAGVIPCSSATAGSPVNTTNCGGAAYYWSVDSSSQRVRLPWSVTTGRTTTRPAVSTVMIDASQ